MQVEEVEQTQLVEQGQVELEEQVEQEQIQLQYLDQDFLTLESMQVEVEVDQVIQVELEQGEQVEQVVEDQEEVVHQEQQVHLIQGVVEEDLHLLDLILQEQQAVQESLLLHNLHFKELQESGQLMTHIITRKLDNGFQFQCRRLAQII
jgi:hypothetical protein